MVEDSKLCLRNSVPRVTIGSGFFGNVVIQCSVFRMEESILELDISHFVTSFYSVKGGK